MVATSTLGVLVCLAGICLTLGIVVKKVEPDWKGVDRPLKGDREKAWCYLKKRFHGSYQGKFKAKPILGDMKKRCAVVSSSGALKAREAGRDIDLHDIIFRFNTAPVDEYTEYVGSKTTFRLGHTFPDKCSAQVCHSFREDDTWHGPANEYHLKEALKDSGKNVTPPASNKTRHLTSGFHGMLTAMANCGSIDAYEMVPSNAARSGKYWYHYWEWGNGGGQDSGRRADKNNWHGYASSEQALWAYLAINSEESLLENGKLTLTGFHAKNCDYEYESFDWIGGASSGRAMAHGLTDLAPETQALMKDLEIDKKDEEPIEKITKDDKVAKDTA